MKKMDGPIGELLDKALCAWTEYERGWWKQSLHGRWVVLEPGPGRLLKDSPRNIREYADLITNQRGRRFSSLSRARAFAREVGGVVRRWRRQMTRRALGRKVKVVWRYETNPWARAVRHMPLWGSWLPDKETL